MSVNEFEDPVEADSFVRSIQQSHPPGQSSLVNGRQSPIVEAVNWHLWSVEFDMAACAALRGLARPVHRCSSTSLIGEAIKWRNIDGEGEVQW